MCHDGNSAVHSVRYLNSQLNCLYENASECVADCGNILNFTSLDYDRTKYSRSLAQYHYVAPKVRSASSTDELFFSALFAKPELKMICDHEAVLFLTIKEGHYNEDFAKAKVVGARAECGHNKKLEGLTVAFRMDFSRTSIRGGHEKIGNKSNHVIQLMILDFATARIVSMEPCQSSADEKAIEYYMTSYLEFLGSAGHHVLFDLPDFDDDKYAPTIDYSRNATIKDVEKLCLNEVVYGIDVHQLNQFMCKKWMAVAGTADHCDDECDNGKDKLEMCLAEMSSKWLVHGATDLNFHIKFGCPKVRALCKHEVIITFDIEQIAFFKSDDWECGEPDEFTGWQISFVVDVIEEKLEGGNITRLILDFANARYSENFSHYEETCEIEIIQTYFQKIVEFFSVEYVEILVQYKMHLIYELDIRVVVYNPTGPVDEPEDEPELEPWVGEPISCPPADPVPIPIPAVAIPIPVPCGGCGPCSGGKGENGGCERPCMPDVPPTIPCGGCEPCKGGDGGCKLPCFPVVPVPCGGCGPCAGGKGGNGGCSRPRIPEVKIPVPCHECPPCKGGNGGCERPRIPGVVILTTCGGCGPCTVGKGGCEHPTLPKSSGSFGFTGTITTGATGVITKKPTGVITLWTERIERLTLFGFDQVTAISEDSINQLFMTLWTRSQKGEFQKVLCDWKDGLFSASLGAMRVRFLSSGKAIFWLTINRGVIHTAKEQPRSRWWHKIPFLAPEEAEDTEAHEIHEICLAFEVDVKMVEEKSLDLDESWYHYFSLSHLFKAHEHSSRDFKHLVLDFSSAELISNLSHYECLLDGDKRKGLEKLKVVEFYCKKYFNTFSRHGHNILHSVPIFTVENCGTSSFGLTSVMHYIVTKETITRETCGRRRTVNDSPVILLLGMCGGRTVAHFTPPTWSAGWVISSKGKGALGTVCLSSKVFLQETILKQLANINALTTIVPDFAGAGDGDWEFNLTTWAKHPRRKNRECTWKQMEQSKTGIEYLWEHRNEWTHEHEISYGDERSGQYSIECHTKNKLFVPTSFNSGYMEIKLEGNSWLKASGGHSVKGCGQAAVAHEWEKETYSSWTAQICISSRPTGLFIEVKGKTEPLVETKQAMGQHHIDLVKIHSAQLPKVVDLTSVLDILKSTLQGNWEYSSPGAYSYVLSNPVFNVNGDLILQLNNAETLKAEAAAAAAVAAATTSSSTTVTTTVTSTSLGVPGTPKNRRSFLGRVKAGASNLAARSSALLSSSSSNTESTTIQTPGLDLNTGAQSSAYFSKDYKGYTVASSSTMKIEPQTYESTTMEVSSRKTYDDVESDF